MIPNAELLIDLYALRLLLDLPSDVQLQGAAMPAADDWRRSILRLAVTVPWLPSIEERNGGRPYLVTPVYNALDGGKAKFRELHITPPDPAGAG